ncbi:MAG: polysaccharide biosynthesis tyrosine autokinase, partial [Gemmataceae bacterium]|nr:polysaccharide biosynthesis tyrosine autokinase [Gemmataceae bacterium]
LKVEFGDSSEVVDIQFSHPEPALALAVANAVNRAYFAAFVEPRKVARGQRVTELEKRYGEAMQGLERKKASFKKTLPEGESDAKSAQIRQAQLLFSISRLSARHDQVVAERRKAETQLALFEARVKAASERAGKSAPHEKPTKEEAPDLELLIDQAMAADADAKRLQAKLDKAENAIDYYEGKSAPESYYPLRSARSQAVQAKQQLAERRKTVAAKVKLAVERAPAKPGAPVPGTLVTSTGDDPALVREFLTKDLSQLKETEANLDEQLKKLGEKAAERHVITEEQERLAEEIKNGEKAAADLYARVEAEKLELKADPRITRLQDAELMKADTKKQMLAALAVPLAVLGAVGFALAWMDCRKRRVRGPKEISRGLGIRVVGAVPRQAGLSQRLVGPEGESDLEGTPVMESIDAIRARLLHEADTRSTRVVMVTSAGPGEGKTTLAAALAASLARAGRKTLLLDGDLRHPSVHEVFGVDGTVGFSEVLIGESELLEAVQDTQLENLSVMPAGQWDREVLGALARGGLEPIFERLAEEFDFVLIDSHPVLEATDALLIGTQADGVLLSVLSDVSQMPRVYAAQQQLASVGIRVLGAVVNAASPEDALTDPQVPAMA